MAHQKIANAALIIFSVVSETEAFNSAANKNVRSPILSNYDKNLALTTPFLCPSFSRLEMAKGSKGFGEKPTKQNKPKRKDEDVSSYPIPEAKAEKSVTENFRSDESLNAGQRSLLDMREQREDKKYEEVRKVKELLAVDQLLQEDTSAAVIPEKVAMRMGARMLPFVGIPLFGGMGAFVAFWYFATYKGLEFQPVIVASSTVFILVISLLGITYSVMSASWDPDDDGSSLGLAEFNVNIGNIMDGLKRTKENAIIRDNMSGMPEEEVQRAIKALDKRDERLKKLSKQEKRLEEMNR